MSRRSVIIYGPQACGKTRNADKLRAAFGLNLVIDDWDGREPFSAVGTLVLTNDEQAAKCQRSARSYSYADAARIAGVHT